MLTLHFKLTSHFTQITTLHRPWTLCQPCDLHPDPFCLYLKIGWSGHTSSSSLLSPPLLSRIAKMHYLWKVFMVIFVVKLPVQDISLSECSNSQSTLNTVTNGPSRQWWQFLLPWSLFCVSAFSFDYRIVAFCFVQYSGPCNKWNKAGTKFFTAKWHFVPKIMLYWTCSKRNKTWLII